MAPRPFEHRRQQPRPASIRRLATAAVPLVLAATVCRYSYRHLAYLVGNPGSDRSAREEQLQHGAEGFRPGRRAALATAGAAGFLQSALGEPQKALAAADPQAWQLKLPRSWNIVQQNQPPPPGDNRGVALIVAGDQLAAGEAVVLRVPLVEAPGEDASAKKSRSDLIKYFTTAPGVKPSVTQAQAVDALAVSQKTQPGLTKFDVGKIVETTRGNGRYIRYDYESSVCAGGSIVKGAGGKDRCEAPDGTGQDLGFVDRKHAITMTVIKEGDVNVLWFADISAPTQSFKSLEPVVNDMSDSFLVADPEELNKAQESYIASVNKQAEDLAKQIEKEMKEKESAR
eukprot:TRINITY_DN113512_c0_g1_i1.p1 TRINITY_DN113512_c0_g1~~TRINITY_DN113512_c0_g1_i1.p1  ORF type:complete len:342 (+),score=103.94 TRINITY_DN113512_c0_g1_i1:82-1107(+)